MSQSSNNIHGKGKEVNNLHNIAVSKPNDLTVSPLDDKDLGINSSYLLDVSGVSKVDINLASTQLWDIFKNRLKYFSDSDKLAIQEAYTQMVLAHGEQRRGSGEYYFTHPTCAAAILASIGMDKDTISACLLHDVPEDTKVTLVDLSKEFSPQIVFLVESVTKLSSLKYKGEDRYAENLRRMFVAMSKDLRVIFIKMADRLHNLHTIAGVNPIKRNRILIESMEIYAPLAERLGISFFRGEIEDVCFKNLHIDEYTNLVEQSNIKIEERKKVLDEVENRVSTLLNSKNVIGYKISGRAKKYFSIWNKMRTKQYTLDKIDDLVAIRIIVKTVDDCYNVLSLIHGNFEVKESRMKDYINRPKTNGYQSLHTSLIDKASGQVFEIQIRTYEMHEFAEFGVASHWNYKAKRGQLGDSANFLSGESFKWISELIDLGKQDWSEDEYLKHVKLDIFNDRIFVLTPKNDVIDLPVGATILDFAYRIHEDIGHHAVMGKIDGKVAKLSDPLSTGNVVQILTDKKQKPSKDWLQFVSSSMAAKHIKTELKKQ